MDELSPQSREIALVELLDRVLDKGVVIAGDITISVADVDLIYLGLRVLLTTPDKLKSQARRSKDSEGSDDLVLRVRDRAGNDIPPE
jgi:gas vesicle structural protein